MKRLLLILPLIIILLVQCKEEDDGATGFAIQVGHSTGAYYFSNLAQPEVVDKDFLHKDVRGLDLDGQGDFELNIVSLYDTIQGDTVLRSLYLAPISASDTSIRIGRVDNNARLDALPYFENEVVDLGLQRMVNLSDPIILTSYEKVISSGAETTRGNWQGLNQMSFIADFYYNGVHYSAWVMITASDYDKYTFYNFASFVIP